MKIIAKQYAQILYQLTKDKKNVEIKAAIKRFAQLLITNHDLAKLSSIIEQFKIIWQTEEKVIEAVIVTARKLNQPTLAQITNYLINLTQAKKVNLTNQIDKNLLAGMIVRYSDIVLDASLKTQLTALKMKMIK